MTKVLIIGSGISGLTCAIECASRGIKSVLVSPFPSERAQSVLAAGGINAVIRPSGDDSIEQHIQDTLNGGGNIAGVKAVTGLCTEAPDIVRWLESLGTVFSRDSEGEIRQRPFGGQTYPRTCFAGASTGKQIVTALVMEARRYEGKGLIERRFWTDFHSALIKDKKCYGALLYNEAERCLESVTADALVIATGGQNAMFGKTTGSTQCDGYAAGRLLQQGVELKNLEFIQYHPTTIETDRKNMLISEAARGEGGRLYYDDGGKRVYFMEDKFGEKGNLMPRDVVSRTMYETGRDIFLDVTFLGKDRIMERIPEVYELCMKYRNIDISRESIPVRPSVHFFMGGIAVDLNHRTNITNLYAVGECASIYHGANRLGGNSLLAAVYSGRRAARDIAARGTAAESETSDWSDFTGAEQEKLAVMRQTESQFPVKYIKDMLSDAVSDSLGIVRKSEALRKGISDIDYLTSAASKINYNKSELEYFNYSAGPLLTLGKAMLVSALSRCESRGAHLRSDYPLKDERFGKATVISFDGGNFSTRLIGEDDYEG